MVGQDAGEGGAQGGGVDFLRLGPTVGGDAGRGGRAGFRGLGRVRRRDQVGDQSARARRVVLAQHDGRRADLRAGLEGGDDLAGLHAETPDLHLVVGAPVVEQGALRGPGHQVAGAVHAAAARAARLGGEAFDGKPGAAQIALGDAGSGHVQLAGPAGRHGPEQGVQDMGAHAVQRGADGRGRAGHQGRAHRDAGGGLGGPVGVDHAAAGGPTGGQRCGARLAADDQGAQAVEPVRFEAGEGGGRDQGVADAAPRDRLAEQRSGERSRFRDDEGGAGRQGHQRLHHRGVERRRCELEDPAAVVDAQPFRLGGGEGGEAPVRGDHSLGRPVEPEVKMT